MAAAAERRLRSWPVPLGATQAGLRGTRAARPNAPGHVPLHDLPGRPAI
jgi:hypothetical protein